MATKPRASVRHSRSTLDHFYQDQIGVPLTSGFVETKFEFVAHTVVITNDDAASNDTEFSFDGTTKHGEAKAGEVITELLDNSDSIWLRFKSGDAAHDYRLTAKG